LGFMVNENVVNVSMHQENLFKLQNDIWESMVEQPQSSLFIPAHINCIAITNLVEEEYENGIRYIKEDQNQDAFIEFIVQARCNDPLYAYFPTSQMRQVEMFLNDESMGVYFDTYRYDIVGLGNFETNESIVFKMKLNKDDVFIDAPLFYHQRMDVFIDYYNKLSSSPFQISRFSNSYFQGEITNHSGNRYVLFTIPYEEDWKVGVDGNNANIVKVFDTLIAVEIPEGTHSITLRYEPGNMYLGITITIFSCAILLVWIIIMARFRTLRQTARGATAE